MLGMLLGGGGKVMWQCGNDSGNSWWLLLQGLVASVIVVNAMVVSIFVLYWCVL